MSYTISIDVPKDHPGLPRLLKAAKELPDVQISNPDGVTVRQKKLMRPGRLVEFFDALEAILGEPQMAELLFGLSDSLRAQRKQMKILRNRLRTLDQIRDPKQLLQEAQALLNPSILGLLSSLKGSS